MSITPQAIKDQEFQVRFRGYDAIEVKAYLELVAEEFFELHELRRKQEDEYKELDGRYQALLQEKEEMAREIQLREESAEADSLERRGRQEKILELQGKVEELEATVVDGEQHQQRLEEEMGGLRDRLEGEQQEKAESKREAEKLRSQIHELELQLTDLQQGEVDFKSTLLAAQKFADDLRKKAEEEAESILEQARQEAEDSRIQAEEQIAALAPQIENLQRKRNQVRDELRGVLNTYLAELDDLGEEMELAESCGEIASVNNDADLNDLFQSITLSDDDEGEVEDLGRMDTK